MSWWVYLVDEHEQPVEVERFEAGGTYALGGTDRAELNITYNYGSLYREAWPEELEDGKGALEQMLSGRTAAETFPLIGATIDKLTDMAGGLAAVVAERSSYWDATPRNAALPLLMLSRWAKQYPEAQWRVS